jgi:hypothetical protein
VNIAEFYNEARWNALPMSDRQLRFYVMVYHILHEMILKDSCFGVFKKYDPDTVAATHDLQNFESLLLKTKGTHHESELPCHDFP